MSEKIFEIEAKLLDTKNYDFQNHDRGTIKKMNLYMK